MLIRCDKNPIIKIEDIKPRENMEVVGVFNPGVSTFRGQTVLLLRVAERFVKQGNTLKIPYFENGGLRAFEFDCNDPQYDFSDSRIIRHKQTGKKYLTSISSFLAAFSSDGQSFEIDYKNRVEPLNQYESYGIEDARISKIGDTYYINYSAVSQNGIVTALRKTNDFVSYEYLANIFHADNKDVSIFEQKIGGLYYALHRPSTSEFSKPEIWLASSPDLVHWGNHKKVLGVGQGFDSVRIGASSIPLYTKHGWLTIYHGCDTYGKYSLGYILLDINDPSRVLKRSQKPFICPQEDYETQGFVNNVVFACGLCAKGSQLNIYYGASDQSVCLAQIDIEDLLKT